MVDIDYDNANAMIMMVDIDGKRELRTLFFAFCFLHGCRRRTRTLRIGVRVFLCLRCSSHSTVPYGGISTYHNTPAHFHWWTKELWENAGRSLEREHSVQQKDFRLLPFVGFFHSSPDTASVVGRNIPCFVPIGCGVVGFGGVLQQLRDNACITCGCNFLLFQNEWSQLCPNLDERVSCI
eukprot:scaffold6584_cov48-Attheya_sp.AAC.4